MLQPLVALRSSLTVPPSVLRALEGSVLEVIPLALGGSVLVQRAAVIPLALGGSVPSPHRPGPEVVVASLTRPSNLL